MEMVLFRHHAMDRHQKARLVLAIHHAVLDLSDRQRVHEIFFLKISCYTFGTKGLYCAQCWKTKIGSFQNTTCEVKLFPANIGSPFNESDSQNASKGGKKNCLKV